jgi:hypothetical protein
MKNIVILSFVSVLVLTGTANSATTTVSYQISAGADDGFAWSATEQDISSSYLMIGDDRTYTTSYYLSAMRFADVDIPRNATIIDVRLKISSIDQEYRGRVYGVIEGEAADDTANFSARNIADANKTAAGIDWDHTTNWTANTYYTSPDVSTVIQEIINRPGWNFSNSLALLYSTRADSGKRRMFGSFETGAGFAATLEITYEVLTISGYIMDLNGAPLGSVLVSADNGGGLNTTDPNGYYELLVAPGWSGSVTPSLDGWGFDPTRRTYNNITLDQTNQNYTAHVLQTFVVRADGTGDYPTIQAAIDAAMNGDIIIVEDGRYTGFGNKDLDFGGRAITLRSTNGPDLTIIDCENNGRGFYFRTGEGFDSVVDGFTITNGNGYRGGGIRCYGAGPTINNCIFSNNYGSEYGGGIGGGNPTISNCIFKYNRTRDWGGRKRWWSIRGQFTG